MATLTPAELITLALNAAKHGAIVSYPTDGKVQIAPGSSNGDTVLSGVKLGSNPAFRNGQITAGPMTTDEWWGRVVQAAAIMYAESGGVTNARCYNIDGPDGKPTCSNRPPAGPRGVDRGLCQWNSVAWPMINDAAADNPIVAATLLFYVSNGYSTWQPWNGSKGLDQNSDKFKTVLKAAEDMAGHALDKGVFGIPGEVGLYNGIQTGIDALGGVVDWAASLGKLLASLVSGAFWRRVGLGAAGLALVVVALVLLSGVTTSVARKAAP